MNVYVHMHVHMFTSIRAKKKKVLEGSTLKLLTVIARY